MKAAEAAAKKAKLEAKNKALDEKIANLDGRAR